LLVPKPQVQLFKVLRLPTLVWWKSLHRQRKIKAVDFWRKTGIKKWQFRCGKANHFSVPFNRNTRRCHQRHGQHFPRLFPSTQRIIQQGHWWTYVILLYLYPNICQTIGHLHICQKHNVLKLCYQFWGKTINISCLAPQRPSRQSLTFSQIIFLGPRLACKNCPSWHLLYKPINIHSCHIMVHHVTSCHIMSHHVTSCHIMSHHVISHHIMLYHVISCHINGYHVISCFIMLYHVISCYIMSHHVISHDIMLYHVISCHIYIYHVISRQIMSFFHIMSYHIISYHGISCHIMSHLVTSCHIMSNHITSCHITSHHVISCHIMSYQWASCYIMSYHVISCHIMLYHMT